jgi:hypothetical protein
VKVEDSQVEGAGESTSRRGPRKSISPPRGRWPDRRTGAGTLHRRACGICSKT